MPHTISKTAFYFAELSDKAKERARDWYRSGASCDDWYESVYSDAIECGAIIGIEIGQKTENWVNATTGKRGTTQRPAIYFSGFWSQGDGACFEGSYRYATGAAKKIREHAPKDERLHAIADTLQKVQSENFYRLTATTVHSGHYYHSGYMAVEVSGNESRAKDWQRVEKTVTETLRRFADWIYRQLEKESEWQNADAQVDEAITANEYEFDESGNRVT